MVVTVRVRMTTQYDADVFNQLAVWCKQATLELGVVQGGPIMSLTISGDPTILTSLVVYLTEKQYGI